MTEHAPPSTPRGTKGNPDPDLDTPRPLGHYLTGVVPLRAEVNSAEAVHGHPFGFHETLRSLGRHRTELSFSPRVMSLLERYSCIVYRPEFDRMTWTLEGPDGAAMVRAIALDADTHRAKLDT